MASLLDIPFLGGYTQQTQLNDRQGADQLRQFGALQEIAAGLQKQQQSVTERQRQEQFRAELVANPERAREIAMKYASPDQLIKMREGQPIGTGLLMPDGTVVAPPKNPGADNRPELLKLNEVLQGLQPDDPSRTAIEGRIKFLTTRGDGGSKPEIVRLQEFAAGLPEGSPGRQQIEARINLLTTRQAPINVYSGSLTPGVDANGNPVFVQPSARPDTPPRVVSGVFPPESAAARKAAGEAASTGATAAQVRERIKRMSDLIQGGSMTGSVVGPQGVAGRIGETVAGVVDPNAATPSLDFKNEQALLLSDVRKMVEKDPNLSKDERERLYETLGGGVLQTPGSALRALNNVLEYVEGKSITGPRQSRRATDAVPAGIPPGSRVIGKTPDGSKDVYQAPDGKRYVQ